VTIPEGGNAPGLAFSSKNGFGGGEDPSRVGANELICAFRNRDGALGIFAQGKARDAESGSFLLDAPGIGEDQRGLAEQAEKIEIADRRDQFQLRMGLDAGLGEALLRAWMNGKNYRNLSGDGINRAEQFGEFFRGVDIGRTMQGKDAEALPIGAVFQCQFFADEGFLGDG